MSNLVWGLILVVWLLALTSILAIVLLNTIKRLADTNKQLLILIAGKEGKPETLRALVASEKPPQGKLRGIATGKKEDKKPKNTDYTMQIGQGQGL